MRAICVIGLVLVAACSQPATGTATSTHVQSAAPSKAAQICELPVWWAVGTDLHAGFLNVPDGSFRDAGVLPVLPQTGNSLSSTQFYGGTYLSTANKWLRVSRALLSPDGAHIVYWTAEPSQSQIHLTDVASGADRVLYKGSTLFIPIAFESDAIYLVHGIQLKQGAFEKLYRLDPSGGPPRLVRGSDRRMYQWGWVMIADGAAWGIGNRVVGNDYFYSVLRLDLTTSLVTRWLEGPANDMFWPLGVDGKHRMYVSSQDQLWRLDAPGRVVQLPDPGPVFPSEGPASPSGFISDSQGVWFSGQAGVWLYSDGRAPKKFAVGPDDGAVWPAGPCS